MHLPPYARRLDVRATRAAFAAGTLGTVGDDAFGENVKRDVEVRNFDGYDANVMPTDHEPREWYDEAERLRQSRLRRWQTRDPGRCFRRAGFEHVGFTKGGLYALALSPFAMPEAELPLSAQLALA